MKAVDYTLAMIYELSSGMDRSCLIRTLFTIRDLPEVDEALH